MLPRLLILSLFLPMCVATVAAQSTPDKAQLPAPSFTLPSSPFAQNRLELPRDFHALVPPAISKFS